MAHDNLNVNEYLTPRDVTTLSKRRSREASTFYSRLVEAFVSSGERAMQVDVVRIGRKPETVRAGLVKAVRGDGLQDKVRVSLIDNEVILVLR